MKTKFLPLACLLFSLVMGFSACTTNIDTMLEEYNSNFNQSQSQVTGLIPGDEGFDERSMLLSEYYVGTQMTLALVAPQAEQYSWTLYSLELGPNNGSNVDNIIERDFMIGNYVTDYEKNFQFYVPNIPKLEPGTYKLMLQVKGYDGEVYIDECVIVVYQQFFIETIE